MLTKLPLSKWYFHKGDIHVPRPVDKGPVYTQSKTERKLTGPAAYHYPDHPDPYYTSQPFPDASWTTVNIPHDYVVTQNLSKDENNANGYLHYDNAWYRNHFTLPENSEGQRITLIFEGIAGHSTVYLNGCLMYHNFSSYNTFEVDISDNVFYDKENVIAVYVNTEEFEGWWYQGGGIYRNVYLTISNPVCIELWGVYAPAKKTGPSDWRVDFETTVLNTSYDDCEVACESLIIDKNGNCVSKAEGFAGIPSREKAVLKYSAHVSDPLLWNCENPNLYSVKTYLKSKNTIIDENDTRIGFRTVEISVKEGFRLNGKKMFINGVCAHQDFGLTGLAVAENIAKYKMRLIKEMGANGYRTSHYQQTEAYLDACDELGILVMDEARWFESTKESLEQLESLVKRDRNRPSVVFWSTSNEEPNHVTDVGKRIHRAVAAHIRKLDSSRLITAAEDKTPDISTIYDDCDIVGINYNLSIYDKVLALHPEKPLFSSECCATGTSRDWNFESNTSGRIRDKDADTNNWFLGREKTYKFLRERDYVFGCFQWAAVEHRGEATWPRICSVSGALDIFLQKKGAYYQNQSHWTDKPMVHIVPHWNFEGLEGSEIPVTVYTNCEELELILNGKSLGIKKIEKYGHGEWNVLYENGILEAKGLIGGKIACTHERKTTGKAVSLKLTQDIEFSADGNDLALFTCECADAEGNIVPDASPYVHFSVNSPAVLVATGSDNCDHTSVALPERQMYMGKIRIAVKPGIGQKDLILRAFSENLAPAVIKAEITEYEVTENEKTSD